MADHHQYADWSLVLRAVRRSVHVTDSDVRHFQAHVRREGKNIDDVDAGLLSYHTANAGDNTFSFLIFLPSLPPFSFLRARAATAFSAS